MIRDILLPKERISPKSIAKYMLLPGIIPWLKRFSFQLGSIFFLITQILGTTRLIDPNHPCLRVENRGQYSFVDVLLLAWSNLRFERKSIPEIMIFAAVVLTCVIFMAILGTGFVYIFFSFGNAHAQYFGTPDNGIPYDVNQDWAFQFLERIFGGKNQTGINFWIQNESATEAGNPWMTGILVGMLKAYSKALLLIASFMVIYIVLVTLADAARSGKPFGESFDGMWAPIRIMLAFALLAPISGSGYNGAQMVVFQAAEWGSNLATNVWHKSLKQFDDCVVPDKTPGSTSAVANARKCNFIASSVSDRGYKFLRDTFMINLCVYGYSAAVQIGGISDKNALVDTIKVSQTSDTEVYSFGNKHSADFCGQIILPREPVDADIVPGYIGSSAAGGPNRTKENYLPSQIIRGYRDGAKLFIPPTGSMMQEVASRFAEEAYCKQNQILPNLKCKDDQPCGIQIEDWIRTYWKVGMGKIDGGKFFDAYSSDLNAYNAWVTEALKQDAKYGWATAGVFYLRMSYAINTLSRAVTNVPRVSKLPANYYKQFATPLFPTIPDKMAIDRCSGWFSSGALCDSFGASQTLSTLIRKGADWFRDTPVKDDEFYSELGTYRYQNALRLPDSDTVESQSPDNAISPITSLIFDSIRIGDTEMNPLGTVISWGDTLFTIASVAYSMAIALSIIGFFFSGFGATQTIAIICDMVGDFFIIPGFTLLFVVPFLPFLYFTFAVVEWAVSVLEAVIGIPLWALTFIRREGDLFAPAMDGIKMLFEIMLRPTIIVFSLLSAVIIFSAGIVFFEDTMKLYMDVYDNTKSSVYTIGPQILMGIGMIVVYMFGVYSMAMSCFKLIEVMPNKFGRWLGLDEGFGASIQMGASSQAVAMSAVGMVGTANKLRGQAVEAVGEGIGAVRRFKSKAESDADWLKRWASNDMNQRIFNNMNLNNHPPGTNPNSPTSPNSPVNPSGSPNKGLPPAGGTNTGYNTNNNTGNNTDGGNTGNNSGTTNSRMSDAQRAYNALNLKENATPDEIKKAYRKLSMEHAVDTIAGNLRKAEESRWQKEAQQKWDIDLVQQSTESTNDLNKRVSAEVAKLTKDQREMFENALTEHKNLLDKTAAKADQMATQKAAELNNAKELLDKLNKQKNGE